MLSHRHSSHPADERQQTEQRPGRAERESGHSGSNSRCAALRHDTRQGDQVQLQLTHEGLSVNIY